MPLTKREKYIDLDGQELVKTISNIGTIHYINKQGQIHRLDGPAVIWKNGYQAWYKQGKYHRLDGPARIWGVEEEYWINDREVSKRDIDLLWLKKQVEK